MKTKMKIKYFSNQNQNEFKFYRPNAIKINLKCNTI
jgi:hypothetical protein